MKDDLDLKEKQLRAEKRASGLFYGLMAGLGFSLSAWGYEAFLFSQASADLPWLKFAIGLVFALLICGLAGLLSAHFDRFIPSLLVWIPSGLLLTWIFSHLPFEGMSIAMRLLDPDLRGMEIYPFVRSADARQSVLFLIVGVISMMIGVFETLLVESSTHAEYQIARLTILTLGLPVFLLAGIPSDSLINQPLREPILAVNDLINAGLQNEVTPFSKEKANDLHLRALDPIKDWLHEPRRLNLGEYDPESLIEATVNINFNGRWARCFAVGGAATFCQRSDDLYLKRLACLLEGSPQVACRMQASPEAQQQLKQFSQVMGPEPVMGIRSQLGLAVLAAVQTQNGELLECRIHSSGDINLQGCTTSSSHQEILAQTTLSPIQPLRIAPPESAAAASTQTPPGGTSNSTSAAGSNPTAAAVLLPAELKDLPTSLANAPRYRLSLDIDFAQHVFQGQAQVVLTNTESVPLERLYFRLIPNGDSSYGDGSLIVTQTKLNGIQIEPRLSLQDSVLEIPLPQPLEVGQRAELGFVFNGLVPVDFGGEKTPAGYGIFNLSQGVMALANWYPILSVYDQGGWNLDPVSDIGDSVYSDMAYYSLDLTAPSNLVVAATGIATSQEKQGDNTRYHFESGPARDFFIALSPDFQQVSRSVEGTTIHSYYLPYNLDGAQTALNVAAASLQAYNQDFGLYPYTELDIVDAPMRNALGVEFPGIVLIGDSAYGEASQPAFATTVAHEVAHQWWYNVVGNDVFDEPWLDEALTTWSSSLYFETEFGRAAAKGLVSYWQQSYDRLRGQGKDDAITQSLAHFESLNDPGVYGTVVYSKGALFFNALRAEIGDQAYFKGLQDYYNRYRFKIATTSDLLSAFESAAGRSLEDFYQQWLYQSAP